MNAINKILLVGAAVLLLCSAIGVIWSKHQARSIFIELQQQQAERDRLDIEWGQLKIQQSYSGTPGRVEQVASSELKMVTPRATEVRIMQPERLP